MALEREGGAEQSFALLTLKGPLLRVGLQREQSGISMFIMCGLRAASVRMLMKRPTLM